MKLHLVLLAALIGATAYILWLQRQLQTARLRGDMYHNIATRLDHRVIELTTT